MNTRKFMSHHPRMAQASPRMAQASPRMAQASPRMAQTSSRTVGQSRENADSDAIPFVFASGAAGLSVRTRPDLSFALSTCLHHTWTRIDLCVSDMGVRKVFRVWKASGFANNDHQTQAVTLLRPTQPYQDGLFEWLFGFDPGMFSEWQVVECTNFPGTLSSSSSSSHVE
jgi:hypothetical protein